MSDFNTGFQEYLTPSVVADFSVSGTQTLLEALQTPEILEETANIITSLIFTELLMLVLEGGLTVDAAAAFVRQAITDEPKAIIFCQVFDVFPQNDAVETLVTKLHKDGAIIKASTLAQFVDSETLVKLDIVPAQSLNRQMNTRKRDEFFTQKKFNLLHEEYEGYSILISEFYSIFNNEENLFLVDHAVKVVYLLIGHYLLDPNRVLDILIDISSSYIVGNHLFVLNFFKKSPWWPQVEGNCNSLESLNTGGNPAVVNLIALRLLKHSPDREIPETFKILISLFIKEGFISFGQVYPYFCPSDEDMEKLAGLYKKELEEKVLRSNASALALAAPLLEEETEGSNEGNSQSTPSRPKDTVDSMISTNIKFQMLKVFVSNGLYWPSIYILSKYPFLANIDSEISELMHRLLAAIIDPLHSKIGPFTGSQLKCLQEIKLLSFPQSLNKVRFEETPISTVYCFKPNARILGNKKCKYFITEWANSLPILDSAKDLIPVSREYLKFFGSILAENHANFIKLCEIIVADLKEDSSIEKKDLWFKYFRNYILPCIGFIKENSIPVDKAFEILSFVLVDDRFNLYGELYQVTAKSNPHVKIAYGKAEKETKDVLKRLSKENVEPMKRRLAKLSHSNPLPCFLTILQQLESYDNLNTLVVETAAYFNRYSWDNLTLAILMRLTSAGRSNKQANGLNERQWIQSLSSFIGKLCQKYPKSVDLDTLLKYLLLSLHSSGNADLIVLKEILSSMGGIQPITNLTQLQIEMINCEPSMQKIVYKTIGDKRYAMYPSGSELRNALMKNENINEFLVLLCKINREIIDSPEISHLKVLASVRDEVDSVLHLLCTLVGFFGKDTSKFLGISDLIENYNVPIVWAFEFWRELLLDADLEDLQSQVEKSLPQTYLEQTNSKLFVLFWKLTLYDLNFSPDLYDNELVKLKSRISSLKEQHAFARRDRNSARGTLESLRNFISEAEALSGKIPSEKEHHENHSKLVEESLVTELNKYLGQFGADDAKGFLQLCVLPRAVHSSFDAIYSAKFIFKLHELGVLEYSLMATLDCLFRNNIFFATLFTCTPTEAENLGMFVSAILKELNAWTNEDNFSKNTHEKNLRKEDDSDIMTFSEFRKNVFEYHTLLLDDVSRALEVTTYMSRMNAITYLKNLLGVYPIVEDHCESVIEIIGNISKREKRDDLKLSSSALIGHVKSRKTSWVHLWDFIDMDEDAKAAQIQKRKEIEDREAKRLKQEEERKLELQRQEERKWQKEEQERQEAEKAKMQKDIPVKSISYDEGTKPTSRVSSRNTEVAKGRYDNYSNPPVSVEKNVAGKSADNTGTQPQADVSKPEISSAPLGPVGSGTSRNTPEAPARPRDVSSQDALSDDLFKAKVVQNVGKVTDTPVGNPQLKSRLEMARKEHNMRKENLNRDVSYTRNNGRSEGLDHTLHSTTPVAPRRSQAVPISSASSSTQSGSMKTTGGRSPLPPQVTRVNTPTAPSSASSGRAEYGESLNSRASSLPQIPRSRTPAAPSSSSSGRTGFGDKTVNRAPLPAQAARVNTPTTPSSSSSSSGNVGPAGGRVPLPPQAPPRDRVNSASKERVPLPPQLAIIDSAQPATSGRGSRAPLPPQQPPRERQPLTPQQPPRYRNSVGNDDRDTNNRTNGGARRPSADPLPPPSLPPPTVPPPVRKPFQNGGDNRGNHGNRDNRGNSDNREHRGNNDNRGNSVNRDNRGNNGNRGNRDNRDNRGNNDNRGNSGNRDNRGNNENRDNRGNNGNHDNRDNNGNRDNRDNHYNRDRKRRFGDRGRESDKRQRY